MHGRQWKPLNSKCLRYQDVLAHLFTVPGELFPPCSLFMCNRPPTASYGASRPFYHWDLGQRSAHLFALLL